MLKRKEHMLRGLVVFVALAIVLGSCDFTFAQRGRNAMFKTPPKSHVSSHRVKYKQHNPSKIHLQKTLGVHITSYSGPSWRSGRAVHLGYPIAGRHYNSGLSYYPSYVTPGMFQSYYRPTYSYNALSVTAPTYYTTPYNIDYGVKPRSRDSYANPSISHRTLDYVESVREEVNARSRMPAMADSVYHQNQNRPIVVATNFDASSYQRAAEDAFRNGDIRLAERNVKHALIDDPDNEKLHLFASHISLANQDYRTAAAQVDFATKTLHQNEWDFVIRSRNQLYVARNYNEDLNRLSNQITNDKSDFDALVLRGFHYGCMGLIAESRRDFQAALALDANNALAKRFLTALKAEPGTLPAPREKEAEVIPSILEEPILNLKGNKSQPESVLVDEDN